MELSRRDSVVTNIQQAFCIYTKYLLHYFLFLCNFQCFVYELVFGFSIRICSMKMTYEKRNRIGLVTLLFLCFSANFPSCFSAANQPHKVQNKKKSVAQPNGFGSSAVFPVQGNVYPLGYVFDSLFRLLGIVLRVDG